MATQAAAFLRMHLEAEGTPDTDLSGILRRVLENATGGRRWTNGTGSGQISTIYVREKSALGAGATDSYDLLAAGALTDIHGQTIDLDELKGFMLLPTSGSIRIDAPAANAIDIFDDPSDLLNVPGDGLMMSWGAAGLDVTTNSKFDITESSGGATADYTLVFFGAS